MYTNPQRRSDVAVQELRREAGRYLRNLREARGLSQRQLADLIGADHYTFISQLETGRGRIPADKYVVWADALDISPRQLVFDLMRYYDPITFSVLFPDELTATAPSGKVVNLREIANEL